MFRQELNQRRVGPPLAGRSGYGNPEAPVGAGLNPWAAGVWHDDNGDAHRERVVAQSGQVAERVGFEPTRAFPP